MEDQIIVYQTFEDPIVANIILTRLKDAGFDCFLSGENIVNLGFLFDSPLAQINLHVFESDVPQINLLLSENTETEDYGR